MSAQREVIGVLRSGRTFPLLLLMGSVGMFILFLAIFSEHDVERWFVILSWLFFPAVIVLGVVALVYRPLLARVDADNLHLYPPALLRSQRAMVSIARKHIREVSIINLTDSTLVDSGEGGLGSLR